MAEIVQQVIENSIQELSVLEKYNLLDSNEIKAVLKKRREYEYRLRKVKKTKDDALRYITYSQNFLALIRIRVERSGLEIDRNEVEKSILDHIMKLFEYTINKFKWDIALWLSYINFCKNQSLLDHVSITYFRMLQIHNKDWLWLQFAKFEFEAKASSETTRKVFLKAISFHSDSKQVWLEYFRFELLYCSKIRKRFKILTHDALKSELGELADKQSNDAIWNGQLASIVYKHAINVFDEFEFAASFIDICNKLDCETTKNVKQSIFEDIKSRFGSSEEFWNLLAQDKLQMYQQQIRFCSKISEEEQLKIKQEAFTDVISIYKTACLNFDNVKMWSYYVMWRFEDLRNTTDSNTTSQKMAEIIFTVDKLWKEDKVPYDIFVQWVKLMYLCNRKDTSIVQKIHQVLKEASSRWPSNLNGHLFIACIMVKLPDKKMVDSVIEKFFRDSLFNKFTQINEENVDVVTDFWQLYLDWSVQSKVSYHKTMKMVTQLNSVSIYAPRRMAEYFKPKVLAIIYHLHRIERARIYYQKNKTVSPICKGFSLKMIEIEKHHAEMEEEPSRQLGSQISSLYDDLIHHFANEDVDIWLAYIRHVMTTDILKVGVLYQKALKSLKPAECQLFVQQYTLLKTASFRE